MAVTIPLPLTPEEQAALEAQAKAQSVAAAPELNPRPLSAGQWEKEFEEWLGLPDMPALSDEAISRESIYTREDDWR